MPPYLDQNGKIQCKRRLEAAPPIELIPDHIIELHTLYNEGLLDLPRPKLYEARKILRRYHLLPATSRRVYKGKTTDERRKLRREYIKERCSKK